MCLEPTKGDAWAREIKETTWPIDRRRRGRRGPDDRHNGRRPIQISYFQIGNICPVHLHFLLPRGSVPTAQWITTELSIPSSAEFTTSWLQNSTKIKSYEPFIQTTTSNTKLQVQDWSWDSQPEKPSRLKLRPVTLVQAKFKTWRSVEAMGSLLRFQVKRQGQIRLVKAW